MRSQGRTESIHRDGAVALLHQSGRLGGLSGVTDIHLADFIPRMTFHHGLVDPAIDHGMAVVAVIIDDGVVTQQS